MGTAARGDIDRVVHGRTVTGRFVERVRSAADSPVLHWYDGDDRRQSLTWAGLADRAARTAGALGALGVDRGDRVVLMLRNRPEFHSCDLGVLLCGATPISIYNSSSPEQIAYLVNHSRAKAAIVDDPEFCERVLAVRDRAPGLGPIAAVDPGGAPGVIPVAELSAHDPVDLDEGAARSAPEDLVTVIYTSGTTGPPKGVMLTHHTICWTCESVRRLFGQETEGWNVVSFLPMAHVAERNASAYFPIEFGMQVTTCPDPAAVGAYLPRVRPEFFFAPPRVFEKLHAGLLAAVAADARTASEFEAALEVGRAVAAERLAGGHDAPARYREAEADVLAPLRRRIGLDQARIVASGAAPIPADLVWFFLALGVPMSEVWGLSETCGPATWSLYDEVRPGSVGRAVPGVDIRLRDDGEVLVRGGNVFAGYLDDPDQTTKALSPEGWFATGDVGELDEDGHLRIVDRKKELLITSAGKNVSPANLEAVLKGHPLIGQACVVGDGRPFLVALVVLDPDVAPAWANERGIDAVDLAALAVDSAVTGEIGRHIEDMNARLSRPEQLKRWLVLGEEWTPDSDVLTPTMKLKRRGVLDRYAREIEALYA